MCRGKGGTAVEPMKIVINPCKRFRKAGFPWMERWDGGTHAESDLLGGDGGMLTCML